MAHTDLITDLRKISTLCFIIFFDYCFKKPKNLGKMFNRDNLDFSQNRAVLIERGFPMREMKCLRSCQGMGISLPKQLEGTDVKIGGCSRV